MGAASVVAVLAACSGASQGGPPGLSHAALNTARVELRIETASPAAHAKPAHVSSATNGIGVTVFFHSDAGHTTIAGSAAFDVSASSPVCATNAAGRTCALDFPAPVAPAGDSDDVVVQTYDTAPVAGSFPGSAKILDTGAVNVTPVPGTTISKSITLSGIPAQVTVVIDNPFAAYDTALYGGQRYTLEVTATDASGATIMGADPYAQPVTLAVTAGTILVNGVAGLQVTRPGDAVTFVAPALGASGTITAPPFSANATFTSNATGAKTTFTTGPAIARFIATGNDGLLYAAATNVVYAIDPANPAALQTIAAPAGYSFAGVATSPPGSPYLAATAAETSGATADVAALSGGTPVQTFAGQPFAAGAVGQRVFAGGVPFVTNGAALCSPTACQSTADVANDAVVGPDGNIWVAERSGISQIRVSGSTFAQYVRYAAPAGANILSIASAADGNLYFTDAGNAAIGEITTSGAMSETPVGSVVISGNIIAGPDRAMWFCARANLMRFDLASHTVTPFFAHRNARVDISTPNQLWATLGPDGAIWTVDSFGKLERFIP